MANKIDIDELIKRKKELEDTVGKVVEKDIRKFFDETGFSVKVVLISISGDVPEINYVKCELSFD